MLDRQRTEWRTSFSSVLATLNPAMWQQMCLGAGQGASQSAGNAVLTSGTTANAETIFRSKQKFTGRSLRAAMQHLLSQRIANNAFVLELVDSIGEGVPYTINSAVSVTFDFTPVPNVTNPFDASSVGQKVGIGAITGAAGVPMQATIASVSGQTVTFTVAGWPASGSGTAYLYGWNFHRIQFDGTVVTTAQYDTGRTGWPSGNTAATTVTTAAPGHQVIMGTDDTVGYLADQLVASSASLAVTPRASRVMNVPDFDTEMYLQLRMTNGTVAPASTTTWTVGRIGVQSWDSLPVSLEAVRPQTRQEALPVQVMTGTTALSTGSALAADVGLQVRASATGTALKAHVQSAATTNATLVKATVGQVVGWDLSNNGASWAYLKLHNGSTAPTAGVGVVQVIGIPPGGKAMLGLGVGTGFTTGIGYTITGGALDADTTAVAAGQVVGDIFYG